MVAVVRSTTAPALFPLRALAVVYTDLFRGIPTILVVFLFCFGIPALRLQGVTNSLFWLGVTALVLSYGAYVAEVFRAGIESVHPSQLGQRRRARADPRRRRCGTSCCRRPCGASYRRCSTTSSRCRRTPRWSAPSGSFEALYAARDYANYNFNFTSYLVAAVLFVALTVPLARFTDWLGRRYARRERAGAR